MKTVRLKTWFTTVSAVALLLILTVSLYGKPLDKKPRPGTIRIQASKITEDGDTVHWRWTITGDRDWDAMTTTESLTGEKTVVEGIHQPSGAVSGVNVSNVLYYELTVKRSNVLAPGEIRYIREVDYHAAKPGGSGSKSSMTFFARDMPVNKLVKILTSKDRTLKLPAKIKLATISGALMSIEFNP
jgi:hypothetical protein